jgi:hypothetical protein
MGPCQICGNILGPTMSNKRHLGPQNSLRGLGPEKTVENYQDGKLYFEPME